MNSISITSSTGSIHLFQLNRIKSVSFHPKREPYCGGVKVYYQNHNWFIEVDDETGLKFLKEVEKFMK